VLGKVLEQGLVPRFPVLDLTFGFVLGNAIGFLDLADQLIAFAGDLVQIVIGQLAPLLLDLSYKLNAHSS